MGGGKEIYSHSSARLHPHPPPSLAPSHTHLLSSSLPPFLLLPPFRVIISALPRIIHSNVSSQPFAFFSHNTGKRLRLHVLLVRAAAPDGQLLLDVGRLHVPGRRRVCGQSSGRRGVHVLPHDVERGAIGEESTPANRMCENGAGGKENEERVSCQQPDCPPLCCVSVLVNVIICSLRVRRRNVCLDWKG
jgi:hypothetical protein